MHYRLKLDINLPRDRVVDLFLDAGNLKAWQPDLVSFETISGTDPRAIGTRNRQVHRMGQREFEMIETITQHDHPDRFAATYEAANVWNLVENRFEVLDTGSTRWVVDNTFRCAGIVRIMATLFKRRFRKQTEGFMQRFKAYAERNG